MTSLWHARQGNAQESGDTFPASDFGPGAVYDVVVVGAGLTGLVTGLLLARAGKHVAIVEADRVGALASGNTTAKLSLLQGAKYTEMLRHTATKNARAYLEGNREGFEWLLRYLDEHGVRHQRRDAYTYASTPEGARQVDDEMLAATRIGLAVEKVRTVELPFRTFGAVRLRDQAQFDPLEVLMALAADFRARGGSLVEGVRATAVRAVATLPGPCEVETTAGAVRADRVVLATGMPFLDRGLYFAKVVGNRSYAVSFRVPAGTVADDFGMYLSVDAPKRSLRSTPLVPADGGGDGSLLLTGGNGHGVGRHPHPRDLVEDLVTWTQGVYPGAEPTHSWSAQDYKPANTIPFVGWLPRSAGRVYLATGFDKWGMTNGVAAGLRIAAELLGGDPPWAKTMGRRMTRLPSQLLGAKLNAEVGAEMATGWAEALAGPELSTATPVEGEGVVGRIGSRPAAVSTVDGRTCAVSAICPHLHGIVRWNDAERTWDCPLHASRFRADGSVIEGPAVIGLAALERESAAG